MTISKKKLPQNSEHLFSIIIPSWNSLEYLKICINSILKNSKYPHQIIVHINDGSDGTLEWLQTQEIEYTHSNENIGVCHALNVARNLATTEYICYVNDDMYLCPNWDHYLYEEIKAINSKLFYLSGSPIEPIKTSNKCCISPYNFGTSAADFNETKLLDEYENLVHHDWSGSSWPPCVVHKEMWDFVGGYSTEFSPGMYSDPDFSMKLYLAGVRIFKGLSQARAYHFMCKSTNKVKRNNGRKTFLLKYSFTSRQFYDNILYLGCDYDYDLIPSKDDYIWRKLRFWGKVKQLFVLLKKD